MWVSMEEPRGELEPESGLAKVDAEETEVQRLGTLLAGHRRVP